MFHRVTLMHMLWWALCLAHLTIINTAARAQFMMPEIEYETTKFPIAAFAAMAAANSNGGGGGGGGGAANLAAIGSPLMGFHDAFSTLAGLSQLSQLRNYGSGGGSGGNALGGQAVLAGDVFSGRVGLLPAFTEPLMNVGQQQQSAERVQRNRQMSNGDTAPATCMLSPATSAGNREGSYNYGIAASPMIVDPKQQFEILTSQSRPGGTNFAAKYILDPSTVRMDGTVNGKTQTGQQQQQSSPVKPLATPQEASLLAGITTTDDDSSSSVATTSGATSEAAAASGGTRSPTITTIPDFVLVYEPFDGSLEEPTRISKRMAFIKNLQAQGCEVFEEEHNVEDRYLVFVLVTLTQEILEQIAEYVHMHVPVAVQDFPYTKYDHLQATFLAGIGAEAFDVSMRPTMPFNVQHFFTGEYKVQDKDRYLFTNDDEAFTQRDRIGAAYELLKTLNFGMGAKSEIGVDRLVSERVFITAFPLHDGPLDDQQRQDGGGGFNYTALLYDKWARWSNVLKYQPLDHIREYFGEKIAWYFAFAGYYTFCLIPLTGMGITAYTFGTQVDWTDAVTDDICTRGDHFAMCPLCDDCPYWKLNLACSKKKLDTVFDNPMTVVYSFTLCLWALLFLQFWKRKAARLQYSWSCWENELVQLPRLKFVADAPFMEYNPITDALEPAYPWHLIRWRRITSGVLMLFTIAGMISLSVLMVIVYRTLIGQHLIRAWGMKSAASDVSTWSAAFMALSIVMIIGRGYRKICKMLTEYETWKTEQHFEASMAWKAFMGASLNNFLPLIYVALVKGQYTGIPGQWNRLWGIVPESCRVGGCFVEITVLLTVLFCGRMIINKCLSIFSPIIKSTARTTLRGGDPRYSNIQKPFIVTEYLKDAQVPLHGNYLKLVIQFGFVVLFSSTLTLIPLVALCSNIAEIRLNAKHFLTHCRRPVPHRRKYIGVWVNCLSVLAWIGIWFNGFLLSTTSDVLPRIVYKIEHGTLAGYVESTLATSPVGALPERCRYQAYRDDRGIHTTYFYRLWIIRLVFVLVFVSIFSLIRIFIETFIPAVPKEIQMSVKRYRFHKNQEQQENTARHAS